MGTIVARKRLNGTTGYTAQIVRKQNGEIVHREAKTFDRKQPAEAWIKRRETELSEPGALDRTRAPRVTLSDAIDHYTSASRRTHGRTKTQVLNSIKRDPIAQTLCASIGSQELVAYAQRLSIDKKPQTVANYLSHLSAVFAVAEAAWGIPLKPEAMKSAFLVLKNLGLTSKSTERDRRPTLPELDKLMTYFQNRAAQASPMDRIIAFALFSTRRMEEITRIRWSDLDRENSRVMVRDMKNPTEKAGNNVWCDLPPEALRVLEAMPREDDRIFPYKAASVSAAFTRACPMLGIVDLHFHDLRHEGVSRLFELGWNIPHVAAVSGHRSWNSLKRYTHIRERGDKYAGWKWLEVVTRSAGG